MEDVSYLEKLGESMHLHDHGRHAAEDGDPLALDELEGPLGVEVVHHDDLPAGRHVGDHARAWQPVAWKRGTESRMAFWSSARRAATCSAAAEAHGAHGC